MRAALVRSFNAPFSIEDVEIDSPGPGEVLVRVAAVAVCHSDIHYLRGERSVTPPFIVGHEVAGVIAAVGPGVATVLAGTPVVVSLIRSCGQCFYCVRGETFHCEFDFALNRESRVHDAAGVAITDAGLGVSGFAEHAVVHHSQVVALPDDMPLDLAALLGCGVITGVGAVVNTARVRPGASVAVLGAGGVGLNAVQGARIAGASTIIALDLRPQKLLAAREFGATAVVDAAEPNALEQVRALTAGRGADYVFITVGSTRAAELGIQMMRTGGTTVLVGLPGPAERVGFVMRDVGWAGQRIIGSTMGSANLQADIPWLIDLWRDGRLPLAPLVSARYPLERIDDAVALVERGEARRAVITFE